jgi:hypothetical protein
MEGTARNARKRVADRTRRAYSGDRLNRQTAAKGF